MIPFLLRTPNEACVPSLRAAQRGGAAGLYVKERPMGGIGARRLVRVPWRLRVY